MELGRLAPCTRRAAAVLLLGGALAGCVAEPDETPSPQGSGAAGQAGAPEKELWHLAEAMGTPRAGHTATPLPDGRVLMVGGGGWMALPIAGAELYVPERGAFLPAAPMREARGAIRTSPPPRCPRR